MALRRIQKEWNDISTNPPEGVRAMLESADLLKWCGIISGPEGTPYEGGFFLINIQFPTDYPFKPPKNSFRTKVYSCNVNSHGNHCLDIDGPMWSPALTVARLLQSLYDPFDPNPDDPLLPDLAQIYKTDKARYNREARAHTLRHAIHGHDEETLDLYYALFYCSGQEKPCKIP